MDYAGVDGRRTNGLEDGDDAVEPPAGFSDRASPATRRGLYEAFAEEGPEAWRRAADLLDWERPPRPSSTTAIRPSTSGFRTGGSTPRPTASTATSTTRRNQLAIRWFGKRGERRSYTYLDLHREVNALAAGLRDLGVEEDDVVTLYLPMVPELPIAMLACARIGAPHNVVFAGLSAEALATRSTPPTRSTSSPATATIAVRTRSTRSRRRTTPDSGPTSTCPTVVVDRLGDALDVPLGDDEHEYEAIVDAHDGETVEPVARDATDLPS